MIWWLLGVGLVAVGWIILAKSPLADKYYTNWDFE